MLSILDFAKLLEKGLRKNWVCETLREMVCKPRSMKGPSGYHVGRA